MRPWERMAGEPAEAWDRFVEFCALGSERSVEALWRLRTGATRKSGQAALERWQDRARRFAWTERAEAWDQADVDDLAEVGRLRAAAELRLRRHLMQRTLMLGVRLLDAGEMEDMEPAEARELAPMARQLVRDMLAALRAEATSAAVSGDVPTIEFRAEDFLEAERRIRSRLGQSASSPFRSVGGDAVGDPLPVAACADGGQSATASTPRLLICVGDDPALDVDLAMLRGVRAKTGLAFHSLRRATRASLARSLRRARAVGRPVCFLHLACHATAAGVEFADGLADGAWLSARLEGVDVLVIASCHGDEVGDWLRVVPHVVTFDDELPHAGAGQFTFAFWSAIAHGVHPGDALEQALHSCSAETAEYVVRHW